MKKQRSCHCGHKMGDAAIEEEPEYTTWGWIMLSMLGMTPRPDHIAFRCMYCRKELGQSRDPKLLAMRTQRNRATV
jgi:hypothetical protein